MSVDQQSYTQFSRAISLLVFLFGALSAGAIISGDELGRVNLIHYILLFCLLPLLSLIAMLTNTTGFAATKHHIVNLLIAIPIWPRAWLDDLQTLKHHNVFDVWLRFVSQLVGLSFSLGCLVAFLLVLLFSDISFVWRSTLLDAQHIYPFLKALAWPWQFIPGAQPLEATLVASQELRFSQTSNTAIDYGSWWAFLFTAQVVYALIPRLIGTLWANLSLSKALKKNAQAVQTPAPLVNQVPVSVNLEPIEALRPDVSPYNLVCWLALDPAMVEQASLGFGKPEHIYQAGFHGDDEEAAIADELTQVVLVAAWEPPLGELKDFLDHGKGIIMPLDFKGTTWQPIAPHYLDEWRRFAQAQKNWSIFVDKELK